MREPWLRTVEDMTTSKVPLSVIVITRNEEQNIVACLASVQWADEIVVVDSQSDDRTVDLAKTFTERIFVREWCGFGEAKNFALSKTSHDWVLWLDADERVPGELTKEIESTLASNSTEFHGYEIARRAFFIGKWIRHCGWYPGYVVRLFKREGARFNDARVHEKVEFAGKIGRLENDLFHYTDESLYHYFSKFNNYTTLAAEDLAAKRKQLKKYDLLLRPPYVFFKMYILKLGFLDGMHGFVLSLLSASYVFTKYAKSWDVERRSR